MLSLPEDWDYTIAGLAQFTADGRVCVANTIRELEERGYIRRNQTRGENGAFAQNEYWIYEVPQTDELPCAENVETVDCASETSESAACGRELRCQLLLWERIREAAGQGI